MVRREQYERLAQHLRADASSRIEMTFAEVARAIGEELPRSAYRYPAWWGSDSNHTQAVWLGAGYVASPNLAAERVTFTRKSNGGLGIVREPSNHKEELRRYPAERPLVAVASRGRARARIFMSYRREDTDYPAAWLYERLASHFSGNQVFKDVDSIELGDDFVEVITTAVQSCEVLLALIGNRWLTAADRDGQRRLDDPNDFVRVEIEAALTRNVRIIPILVEGARMPRADELPASLAMLTRHQALELSPSRFGLDTGRLLNVLDRTITRNEDEAASAGTPSVRNRSMGQAASGGRPQADVPPARQGTGHEDKDAAPADAPPARKPTEDRVRGYSPPVAATTRSAKSGQAYGELPPRQTSPRQEAKLTPRRPEEQPIRHPMPVAPPRNDSRTRQRPTGGKPRSRD